MLVEDVAESGLESASIVKPPVDFSSTRTRILWSMLHGSSILASRREERVQKAVSIDLHEPGDAGQSHWHYTLCTAQKATLCPARLLWAPVGPRCSLWVPLRAPPPATWRSGPSALAGRVAPATWTGL